jgi:hypothetical protein
VGRPLPAEMRAVALSSTSIYHVNMSVFRSAPDMWAIGQVCATSPPFPRAAERAKPRGVCTRGSVEAQRVFLDWVRGCGAARPRKCRIQRIFR